MINQRKFAAATLDLSKKAFVIEIVYLGSKMTIYPTWKAQIALLITKKVVIPAEYLNFANIFLKKSAAKLLKSFDINKHPINLELNK